MARKGAKEWVLNLALNRWQFNRPKYVGKLSEAIRECAPKSLEDWKVFPEVIGEIQREMKRLSDTT
ncbi:MAG: MjaI family restriction endonuclease [Armatimonadetes bacterium]|nr:MjaI family restriction endonuclease [Armatimonadota bacterium]